MSSKKKGAARPKGSTTPKARRFEMVRTAQLQVRDLGLRWNLPWQNTARILIKSAVLQGTLFPQWSEDNLVPRDCRGTSAASAAHYDFVLPLGAKLDAPFARLAKDHGFRVEHALAVTLSWSAGHLISLAHIPTPPADEGEEWKRN